MALLNKIMKIKSLIIVILLTMSSTVLALTSAGTSILNQAVLTFFDTATGNKYEVLSNISKVKVESVYAVTLTPDIPSFDKTEMDVNAGFSKSVPHTVTNAGNIKDSYTISVENLSGDNGDLFTAGTSEIKIFVDVDGNGILDPGEPELQKNTAGDYLIPELYPDQFIELVFQVAVPATALDLDYYDFTTTVISQTKAEVTSSTDTRLIVTDGPVINLTLDHSYECHQLASSFTEIDFNVHYTNTGAKKPDDSDLPYKVYYRENINDPYTRTSINGVMISVKLPPNITLLQDKIINGQPARDYAPQMISPPTVNFQGGIVLVGINTSFLFEQEDLELEWYDYSTWDGTGAVEKIGFLVKADYMGPNTSGSFNYYTEVNDLRGRSEFLIESQAQASISNTEQKIVKSDTVCNTLTGISSFGLEQDLISFETLNTDTFSQGTAFTIEHANDDHFEPTDFYYHGDSNGFDNQFDGIHAQINLPQGNEHASTIDIIGPESSNYPVILRSDHGDIFYWIFAETGPNTGVFRSVIPAHAVEPKTNYNRASTNYCLEDNVANMATGTRSRPNLLSAISDSINFSGFNLNGSTADDCEIQSQPDDDLVVEVLDGYNNNQILMSDVATVSPKFNVFDSTNFRGVENAVVKFYQADDFIAANSVPLREGMNLVSARNTNGQEPILQTVSDNNGDIFFPKLSRAAGQQYFVTVEPPETHTWPSIYTNLDNFNLHEVVPASYGLDGHEGVPFSGSREVAGANQFDIPVDPVNLDRRLVIEKDADVTTAEIGGLIKYTIKLQNNLPDSDLFNVHVYDTMPYGFKYISGSARLNDVPIADPTLIEGTTYRFSLQTLTRSTQAPEMGTFYLTYLLQLTAGAMDSDGINTAYSDGAIPGGTNEQRIVSNLDSFQVEVTQTGVLSERGIIFGKVFIDTQCDFASKSQIWPIGGVKLYLETGDYVITDENGQYSLFGVKPGNHVIKVDTQTLPEGIRLIPIDTRNAGVGDSRFVDLKRGEMHRADFTAPCPTENQDAIYHELKQRNSNINGDWLFDTAERFQGLQYDATPKAIEEDALQSGIISGPSTLPEKVTSSKSNPIMSFKGYALVGSNGSLSSLEKLMGYYPSAVLDEAYIYPEGDDSYSIRFGFADQKEKLSELAKSLTQYQFKYHIAETVYNKIPTAAQLRIDNVLDRAIPQPEKAVHRISREEAKVGTWYWPTNEYSYDGRFIAVVPAGVTPQLYVNEVLVSSDHLGEQITNTAENAQILGWYGVKLNSGENRVEIKANDAFGNERLLLSKIFSHPKSAKRISISADSDTPLVADGGRSAIPISIKLFDDNNHLAHGSYFVTLDTDHQNQWLEPDIQPSVTGYQVRVNNGQKTVHLRSSEDTGEIIVEAYLDHHQDKIKLYQVAAKRPLLVSGILNYTARHGDFSGNVPSSQSEGYEHKHYSHSERAAVFMKGNIKGGMHLTLSYDSDKEDEEFYREVSPDSYYPLPGDASVKGYDARSTSKLYAKIEKERHFIMWGDYTTNEGSDDADLARTSQVLTGVNSMYNDGRFTAQIYGARPEDLHKVVEFRGNGTAMLYNIGETRIVRNSDTVSLVTYDRNSPGLVLEQQQLSRYIDYTINYFSGDMRFNRVIPQYDSNLNPVFIRVNYNVDSDGDPYTIAGAKLSYLIKPNLRVGASYEYNESPIEGFEIGSIWANLDLDSKTKVTASVAGMTHKGSQSASDLISVIPDPANKIEDGMAYKLNIQRDWNERSSSEIEFAYAEEGFTNTTGGISTARQEIRLRHRQKLTGLMNLNVEGNHSESLIANDKQQSVALTVDSKLLGTDWTTKIGSRYIKNETDSTQDEMTTAIVGLGRSFTLFGRQGRVDTEYEQSFNYDKDRRFNVKADWQAHKQASIYAQYEHIDSLSGISALGSGAMNIFSAGVNVDWVSGGTSYNEFRQRGGADGRSMELANGYRDRFEIEPGLSIDPSFEYVEILRGTGTSGIAVSLGIADVRHANYKTTGRFEYRHGELDDYYGVLGAWVTRLSQDWSGLVREDFRYIDNKSEPNTWSSHLSIGAAYRPRLMNNYDMLVAYEWKSERTDIDRMAHILSTHQNYKVSPKWTLSGRLGMKWEDFIVSDQKYDSITSIADARAIYYINRRWDLDFNAGVLGTDWLKSRRYSFGIGLNYLVTKNLRAGIGYNVIGFDDKDLDPLGYNLQGVNFDIMFKLDENLFDWLSE